MFEIDFTFTIDKMWGLLFGASVVVVITFVVFGWFKRFLDRLLP